VGAFIFGLVAGSSLPVPLPYLVVTFTLGGMGRVTDNLLIPLLVGLSSGLGAGLGGTLVYLFGRGGSNLVFKMFMPNGNNKVSPRMAKLLEWAENRGSIVVFFMSAMLNPAFAPMAIALGAMRFRLIKFFLWCTAGNMIKSLILAYCGYLGLGTLLRWLDIFR
jgi:membrane protein DedA with SNARE-associated domain